MRIYIRCCKRIHAFLFVRLQIVFCFFHFSSSSISLHSSVLLFIYFSFSTTRFFLFVCFVKRTNTLNYDGHSQMIKIYFMEYVLIRYELYAMACACFECVVLFLRFVNKNSCLFVKFDLSTVFIFTLLSWVVKYFVRL